MPNTSRAFRRARGLASPSSMQADRRWMGPRCSAERCRIGPMAVLAPPDRRNAEPGSPGRDDDPAGTGKAESGRTDVRSGNAVPVTAVTAMFDEIAPVYDRLNTVMTFGADGRWRQAAADAAALLPGGAAIDVAAGTGKLAAALADRVGPFGRVLAVDLS